MTISADTTPDDSGKINALAPIPEMPGIDPFVAAKPDEAAAPRGMRARLSAAGGALEVHASSSGALLTAILPRRAAA